MPSSRLATCDSAQNRGPRHRVRAGGGGAADHRRPPCPRCVCAPPARSEGGSRARPAVGSGGGRSRVPLFPHGAAAERRGARGRTLRAAAIPSVHHRLAVRVDARRRDAALSHGVRGAGQGVREKFPRRRHRALHDGRGWRGARGDLRSGHQSGAGGGAVPGCGGDGAAGAGAAGPHHVLRWRRARIQYRVLGEWEFLSPHLVRVEWRGEIGDQTPLCAARRNPRAPDERDGRVLARRHEGAPAGADLYDHKFGRRSELRVLRVPHLCHQGGGGRNRRRQFLWLCVRDR